MKLFDTIGVYLDNILAFLGGIITSILLLIISGWYQRREERKKDIIKSIREFYPIIEDLNNDLIYAMSIQSRDSVNDLHVDSTYSSIYHNFAIFKDKYNDFRLTGLEPELEKVKKELYNYLKGTYNKWNIKKESYVLNDLEECVNQLSICKNLIEDFLKS